VDKITSNACIITPDAAALATHYYVIEFGIRDSAQFILTDSPIFIGINTSGILMLSRMEIMFIQMVNATVTLACKHVSGDMLPGIREILHANIVNEERNVILLFTRLCKLTVIAMLHYDNTIKIS
jgi:hypothetical protein